MKQALLLVALMLPAIAVAAPIYKWVDDEGVAHFSDTPVEGAEEINLPPANVISIPAPSGQATPTKAGSDAAAGGYQQFEITSPSQDETIRDNQGNISMKLAIKPPLDPGHKIRIFLDGVQQAETKSTGWQFHNVDRGAHTLGAEIVDADGKVIHKATVSVYLHRQSALFKKTTPTP